jgi:hypothetical protein
MSSRNLRVFVAHVKEVLRKSPQTRPQVQVGEPIAWKNESFQERAVRLNQQIGGRQWL